MNEEIPRLGFGQYKGRLITDVPTSYLNWIRRTSDVSIPALDDELASRGEHEPRLLRPLPKPYDEKESRRIFADARRAVSERKRLDNKKKNRRKRKERRLKTQEKCRQDQRAVVGRVKAGFTLVGQDFDPGRCDGSCPF